MPEFKNEIVIGIAVGVLAGLAFIGLIALASSESTSHLTPTTNSSQVTTTSVTPNCSPYSGKPLYLRLIEDSTGKPIQNANVSSSPGFTCDEGETLITILFQPPVNSSGVAILNDSYSSWWVIDLHYSGNTYHFKVDMRPHQTTYVTVRLPSGNRTVTYG